MTPASEGTPEGGGAGGATEGSPSAPTGDERSEDTDRHVLRLTWDMAIASLDQVITPSLADFLQ